jgi:hypothetical protein
MVRDEEKGEDRVVMTLLTRAGAKAGGRELAIPVQSGLADRMLERRQAEEEARRENKRFVMQ